MNFNPHSREGSDNLSTTEFIQTPKNFNPHSREGSDCLQQLRRGNVGDFNPHSREGSDCKF